MKHIKKKYYFEKKEAPLKPGKKPFKLNRFDNQSLKKVKKEGIPFIKTTDGDFILSMFFNNNGTEVIIPIPDLTLVYYNNAYLNNRQRKEQEKVLFKKLSNPSDITEHVSNELYSYIGSASSSIIQMFTSLESFINYMIPDDIDYSKKRRDRTEVYNKEQIQLHIKFWDKVKEVLPYYYNSKNFFKKQTPTNSHLVKLKEIRDEIVHTKSKGIYETQSKLVEKLLKFKYEDTLKAIRKFMNFYVSDYIVDCDCSNDF